jgi:hypothetical protein
LRHRLYIYPEVPISRWENLLENGINLAALGTLGYYGLSTVLNTPQVQGFLSNLVTKPTFQNIPKERLFEVMQKATRGVESLTPEESNLWERIRESGAEVRNGVRNGTYFSIYSKS